MHEMIEIADSDSLDKALGEKRAVIFKHSTRCPISAAAKQQVTKFCSTCPEHITVYYIDVLQNRTISNETEQRTGIIHQSPETLFIKDGVVTGHLTHWDISAQAIEKAMNGL